VIRVSRESGAVENITSLPGISAVETAVKDVTSLISTSTAVSVKDTTVSLSSTDEIAMNDIPCSGAVVEMKQTPANQSNVVDSMGQPNSNVEAEEINQFGSKNQWFKIWLRRLIYCLIIFMY